MENKTINIGLVIKVAQQLGTLNDKVVFVGGAVVSVYADDPAAEEVRPTDDIDFTLEITGYREWAKLNEELLSIGFEPNPQGHAMCNFMFDGINIDIMPAEDSQIGISNRWYKPGFEFTKKLTFNDQTIRVLSVPFFIATKLEAFNDRGVDHRTSHDFEDVIYVIDNCTTLVEEIKKSEKNVKTFIIDELKKIMANPHIEEIIQSQIHPNMAAGRFPLIIEKIKQIIE
jgi:predicted nucleotidyltransferase